MKRARNDDAANQSAAGYLSRLVTRVEVAERIEVPVVVAWTDRLLNADNLRGAAGAGQRPEAESALPAAPQAG
ncbi:hypothetical protein [Pseudarthrobacter sp. N5]|uniref:hypothetical protein n=1 Tax=Pseudarthrobacter sp. N5 TaxID=3418416 RepID=UPI003CF87229